VTTVLRDYQSEAIAAVKREWLTHRSTLLVLATGLGKSVCASHLLRDRKRVGRSLVLVHREELLQQMRRHLEAVGLSVEIERAEESALALSLTPSDCVVATVQTLKGRRLERWPREVFSQIVVDEAHRATAASYREIFDHFYACKVLGLTATGDRTDGVGLGHVFESIAMRYEIGQGIADGWLVPLECKRYPIVDLRVWTGGDLNETELDSKYERAVFSIAKRLVDKAGSRPTLAFMPGVASARALASALKQLDGVDPDRVASVDGQTTPDERQRVTDGFISGSIQYVANCFDMDTELLTKDGWANCDEIGVGTVLAAVDPHSGDLSWEPCEQTIRRPVAPGERMVHIRNQCINLRVTEGHRMLWKTRGAKRWKITEAGELVTKAGPYDFRTSGLDTFPGAPLADHDLEFLGLFASDGHLNVERASIQIAQSVKSSVVPEIERILTACEFDWKRTNKRAVTPAGEESPQYLYRIPKGTIGGQLKRRGWGRLIEWLDKSFHPALGDLMTPEQYERLYHGMWVGDGFKAPHFTRPNGGRTICNTDTVLIDRLQEWGAVRGFHTSSSWFDNGPLATKQIAHLRVKRRRTIGTNNRSVPTSGGNPARFEDPTPGEEVWCVTTQTGTVIARRGGRVTVAGQCMLWTEGFDAPPTACVALCRPTKSRSFLAQMIGRGTRTLPGVVDGLGTPAERRAAIAASAKPDTLLIEFTGRHRIDLANPAEVLAGRELPEDALKVVREATEDEADTRSLEEVKEDALEYAKQAEEERELQSRRDRVQVIATSTTEPVELVFAPEHLSLVEDVRKAVREAARRDHKTCKGTGKTKAGGTCKKCKGSGKVRGNEWHDKGATPAQKEWCARWGVRLPGRANERQTKAAKDMIVSRGLPSLLQLKTLRRFGLNTNVKKSRAGEAMTALKATNWVATPEIVQRFG